MFSIRARKVEACRGISLRPGYRASERLFSYFARLQPDEGRRKVVGPPTEGAI
jgi:hypothetical protein